MEIFMKFCLLAATALVSALLLSIPAGAAAPAKSTQASSDLPLAGVIDVKGGYRHIYSGQEDFGDGQFELAGNGRLSVPLSNMFTAQFDLQAEHYFGVDDDGNDTPTGNALFGAHLSARNTSQWLFGGFAAVAMPSQLSKDDSPVDEDTVKWEGGLEAQWYINDFTLYGQGGWANMKVDSNGPEGFLSGKFGRGVVRYFITDDAMVNAEYSYAATRHYVDGDDNGRFHEWNLGGAMRVCNTHPLYGTLDYRGGFYDSTTEGENAHDHSILAGLKYQFGVSSLKHNDRHGATLDLPMLPVRAASWEENLD
jgi:hypothetical protein